MRIRFRSNIARSICWRHNGWFSDVFNLERKVLLIQIGSGNIGFIYRLGWVICCSSSWRYRRTRLRSANSRCIWCLDWISWRSRNWRCWRRIYIRRWFRIGSGNSRWNLCSFWWFWKNRIKVTTNILQIVNVNDIIQFVPQTWKTWQIQRYNAGHFDHTWKWKLNSKESFRLSEKNLISKFLPSTTSVATTSDVLVVCVTKSFTKPKNADCAGSERTDRMNTAEMIDFIFDFRSGNAEKRFQRNSPQSKVQNWTVVGVFIHSNEAEQWCRKMCAINFAISVTSPCQILNKNNFKSIYWFSREMCSMSNGYDNMPWDN